MKRLIYATEVLDASPGFFYEYGNVVIFYKTDATYCTDKIVRKFINTFCDLRGIGDAIRQKALYDKPTLDDFRRRIDKAYLEEKDTGKIIYYTISGKGFTLNFPEEDFKKEVTII